MLNRTAQKITDTAHIAGCDRETAVRYLIAEEWIVTDAVYSYRADMQAAAQLRAQYGSAVPWHML